ncbi:hypothetical protein LTR62_005144 [Meristemomyces frigidus]|uniref:Carboxylic ester hydrolase n=1 Tax=Meristemomyces frigidus TaxID=1508187 RepID=A0AAN7YJG7_9PEZI|nr:hypothetical protein LTR62_005144 [Meristemomyces frigidus]
MSTMAALSSIAAAIVGLMATVSKGQATQAVGSNNSSAPMVDLGYVKYQGYTNATAGINYFRGIQYAAAPTGALRWQKPRPIEASNNFHSGTVYNATQIAPACYQSQPYSVYVDPTLPSAFIHTPQGQSENCLILDVLVPDHPVSSSLPVMVQIHGGGYTQGNAQSYPGDAMVNASNGNMIYVSMQYRLGMLGFLAGGEVMQNGVANAGLLDQRAALDWIQRNIRAFGGDPSQVTIWGGSAGGGSVTYQLIAGGAYDEPPYSAAIAEYPWFVPIRWTAVDGQEITDIFRWQPFLNSSQQDKQFDTTLQLANCSSITCLRSLSSSTISTLSQKVENASYPTGGDGFGVYYWGPVVDYKFIKELPSIAFSLGHFYDVPLMVDHDAYEGVIFSNMSLMTQAAETTDAEYLFPFAGPAFFSRLYELYPMSDYNSTFFQRQTWFGDFIINCPTYQMATNAVDRNTNSSAVFKLTFAAGSEEHGATTPFLASNITGWPGANNHTLAEIMSSYWISFATTHDPNLLRVNSAPYWPSYISDGAGSAAVGESVGFDTLAVTYTTIGPKSDPDADAKCEFFGYQQFKVQN